MTPATPGARFRVVLLAESQLQEVGAINAIHALLARRVLMARPGITVKGWATREPYYEAADLEAFLDGIRVAGFPEE